MAAHRYWRLFFISTAGSAYAYAEVQFRTTPGTPLVFSGGTASAAETFAGYPASNAADNNPATLWSGSDNAANQWWEYDYGVGNALDIQQVTITARNDANYNQAPSLFQLQYSDNNSTWTSVGVFSAAWSAAGQTQTFTVISGPSPVLLWTDGFESYAVGVVPSPWLETGGHTLVSTAQPHSGAQSLGIGQGGNGSYAYRPLINGVTQWYADFWMWTNTQGGTTNQYIAFTPTATTDANCVSVSVSSADGSGRCGLSGGAAWITFSTTLSTWHHYLLEVTSAAAGTAKLTVDGVVVGTYSGDTRDSGSSSAYVAYAFVHGATIGPAPAAEFYLDDLSVYGGVVGGGSGSGTTQARAMVMA